MRKFTASLAVLGAFAMFSGTSANGAGYGHSSGCSVFGKNLHSRLETALKTHVAPTLVAPATNGGLDLNMWASIVARDGSVCAVARTGDAPGDQWPGSRVISAQKANTANAFSLPGLALSTANLWAATQPGGSLFGLQFSNPVNPSVAYRGSFRRFGTRRDPLVGKRPGGVNVFGGGLALYTEDGAILGAIGVSGDTSCADHNIAWRVRDELGLDFVPAGVAPGGTDNIIFDITPNTSNGASTISSGGFGHPDCGGAVGPNQDVVDAFPIGPNP